MPQEQPQITIDDIDRANVKKFIDNYNLSIDATKSLEDREKSLTFMREAVAALRATEKFKTNDVMKGVFERMEGLIEKSTEYYEVTKKLMPPESKDELSNIEKAFGIEKPKEDDCNKVIVTEKKEENTNGIKVSLRPLSPRPTVNSSAKYNKDGSVTLTREVTARRPTHSVLVISNGNDPKVRVILNNMKMKQPNVVYRHLNLSHKPDYATYIKLQPYLKRYGRPNINLTVGKSPAFYKLVMPNVNTKPNVTTVNDITVLRMTDNDIMKFA